MDNESRILAYARSKGAAANHAELVSQTVAGDFYALSYLDEAGFPMPTGLPQLVKAKGDNYTLITGDEALALLNSFGLEE